MWLCTAKQREPAVFAGLLHDVGAVFTDNPASSLDFEDVNVARDEASRDAGGRYFSTLGKTPNAWQA